jgi:hypothetical protein
MSTILTPTKQNGRYSQLIKPDKTILLNEDASCQHITTITHELSFGDTIDELN